MSGYSTIKPGKVWLDRRGSRIQAHGGSIIHIEGTFYWYGENKERTGRGSGIWHWGVRCYASTDLYNWADQGLIIPPTPEDPDSPLHPSQLMDRPHIVYNRTTAQYVCWLKISSKDGRTQASTILVADSILGPYRIVRTGVRPLGMDIGDFDLVVDPTNGKAYCFFEKVHSELICADLTEDYTDVTGHYSAHFPRSHPPYVREAPAHFVRNAVHYLVTSGTTWYFPNESEVACAATQHGPWTVLGNPHPADSSRTSFRSQISSVFKHPDKKDLYIALADRWLPGLSADAFDATAIMARFHAGEICASVLEQFGYGSAPDTSIADYVWLPIHFVGGVPRLDWRDEWRVEDYE